MGVEIQFLLKTNHLVVCIWVLYSGNLSRGSFTFTISAVSCGIS